MKSTIAASRSFLVVFFLFGSVVFAGESFVGKVVSVTDGDTLSVLHDGKAQKVRLYGIDCPESHQPFGTRAKQFTSRLAFGKQATVDVKSVDRYGRTVGEVKIDTINLNEELVKQGMAWWYVRYAPKDARLGSLESEARASKRGLWGDVKPIPPWEYRASSKRYRGSQHRGGQKWNR